MLLNESAPDGRVVGIEKDDRNRRVTASRLKGFEERALLVKGDYRNIDQILDEHNIVDVSGILLDLGFSSAHVDDPTRGFSFQSDGPLDMRYDSDQELTAAKVVNSWPEGKLAETFLLYGEEKHAKRIAQAIVARRREVPFKTTKDLAETIHATLGRRGKIHPATRVFQALRIVVNDELGGLEEALPKMVDRLQEGGRLCVISFHSLEDRIVKHFFKGRDDLKILTKKPVGPGEIETKNNPRARSAKLRVAEKQKQHDRSHKQKKRPA